MSPASRGLQYCPVDLHVHTPASRCFIDSATPEDIVKQALAAGMRAIAITDHNTGAWVDPIKAAAQGTGLVIFPGVEISVQPGVHVVAIFPEDKGTEQVHQLLWNVGIDEAKRGDEKAIVTLYGVPHVLDQIRKTGALPVLAHIDAPSGAWYELRSTGQTLIQLWEEGDFAAVEIVGDSLPPEVGKSPFVRCPAYYWSSDNPHPENPKKHSHFGIGSRYSLFKLDEPISWEGLRLCFQDHRVRIYPRHSATHGRPAHPVIESIDVRGGVLDGLSLSLNPNLNCLVGGRGTGKSALVEMLRYAFDLDAKAEANVRQATSLVGHVLSRGATVQVDFSLGDGTAYILSRTAGQPPSVRRGDSTETLTVRPADLLPMQVYGQKEIYEISGDPEFQRRLIDNYVAAELAPLQQRETRILQSLSENAGAIAVLQSQIEFAQEQLARIDLIREELWASPGKVDSEIITISTMKGERHDEQETAGLHGRVQTGDDCALRER